MLLKGLKFVSIRKNIHKGKLIVDLDIWERRMRLREYFYNEEEVDSVNECKTKKNNRYGHQMQVGTNV